MKEVIVDMEKYKKDMNPTILKIKCKRHGLQRVVSTIGGIIYCEKCLPLYQEARKIII